LPKINNILYWLPLIFFSSSLVGLCFITETFLSAILYLELILFACVLNFIYISIFFIDFNAIIYGLFLLPISAGEIAFGLTLILKITQTKLNKQKLDLNPYFKF
jgi:NADH:ubiquinone oxidoreductase subunit K